MLQASGSQSSAGIAIPCRACYNTDCWAGAEFLVQVAWVRACESAFLTIPGDVEAAGLGTTLGAPLLQAATFPSMCSATEMLKGTVLWVVWLW